MSNTERAEEIKICPCCEGKANVCKRIKAYFDMYAVICSECSLRTKDYPTVEMAIEIWNTRKPVDKMIRKVNGLKRNMVVNGQDILGFSVVETSEVLNILEGGGEDGCV